MLADTVFTYHHWHQLDLLDYPDPRFFSDVVDVDPIQVIQKGHVIVSLQIQENRPGLWTTQGKQLDLFKLVNCKDN